MERTRTYSWSNPLETAATGKTMRGYDFLNGIFRGEIPPPPIAETLDFFPTGLEEGRVTFAFTAQEFHYNPIGTVHGGVITTVLDTAMGCALQSTLPQGVAYTTVELKVNFIKAVTTRSGKLTAEGRLIHAGQSTALIEADLRSESGTLYAHGVSTCMLFKF